MMFVRPLNEQERQELKRLARHEVGGGVGADQDDLAVEQRLFCATDRRHLRV